MANLNKLERSQRKHINCIRFGTGGIIHEFSKFLLAWMDKKMGYRFIQEAKFKYGGRTDHFRLKEKGIEVMDSETENSGNYKNEKYPVFVDFMSTMKVLEMFKYERPRDFCAILSFINGVDKK